MLRLIKQLLILPVLGCGGGSAPKPPPPPPPPPQAPQEQDAAVVESRDNDRARRRAAGSKTIQTSSQGVTGAAPTQAKTLLGQ